MSETIENLPFLLAAALSFITFLIHLFAGGPEVARPLLQSSDLAPVPKLTAYYCWHLVSITLAAMSVGFLIPAVSGTDRNMAIMWTAIAAGFAVWSGLLVIWKRQPPLHLPQWALFLPIAVCGIWGLI
ncbi:MAG: hypothetical protein AAF367_14840 [Pseudomonadota bacterium]